jgi:hypothetical protein
MTYFKTRGRRPVHIHPIDQRIIDATIDPPLWWRTHVDLVAEQAPAVSFDSECPSDGPNPLTRGDFVFETEARDGAAIVTRYGITGLDTGRQTEIRLARPAAVVDVGVAHFGEPPSLAAYARDKTVAESTADERPRQIENLRLLGNAIDRVTVSSPDGTAVINYVRAQPETPARPARRRSRRTS